MVFSLKNNFRGVALKSVIGDDIIQSIIKTPELKKYISLKKEPNDPLFWLVNSLYIKLME
jgi:hypothetical protein